MEESSSLLRDLLNISARTLKLGKRLDDPKIFLNLLEESRRLGLSEEFCRRLLGLLIEEKEKVEGAAAKKEDGLRLRRFAARAMEMRKAGRKVVRLELGEPDFSASEKVIEAACEAIREGRTKYSSAAGLKELKEEIASNLSNRYGVDLKTENIAITAGGTLATYAAIEVLSKPGDSVMVIEPAWPLYAHQIKKLGRRVVKVRTKIEDGWDPVEAVKEKISRLVKIIILNYPNNPTGKVLDRKSFKGLLDLAEDYDAWIVSDEVYIDFSYNGRAPSILEYDYPKTYYLNSFSKTWGMTGFRIGFVITDPEIAGKVSGVLSTVMTCVPEFIQRAALAALRDEESRKRNVELIGKRLKVLYEELSKSRLIQLIPPEGAMYVFPKIKAEGFSSWSFAEKLLEKEGVAVAPGACFGEYYDDHLRISAVVDEAELRDAAGKIVKAVEEEIWRKD